MVSRISLPRDGSAEEQLLQRIQALEVDLLRTVKELVAAKVDLEIRQYLASGIVPVWLRPARRSSMSHDVMNALRHHLVTGGLSFRQLDEELRRAGRAVHKPTLTATLGKLKREEKILRAKGRWTLRSPANEPVEPPEREYEKEDWMD